MDGLESLNDAHFFGILFLGEEVSLVRCLGFRDGLVGRRLRGELLVFFASSGNKDG